MDKQTVKDASLRGKTVLVRVDYNVPISADGQILDDFRVQASLPTIRYLLERDCAVHLISHLGRPTPGQLQPNESLRPVSLHLAELLSEKVDFRTDIADASTSQQRVVLYENLRFWPGEEDDDPDFAQQLAQLGDIFVQDGFGVSHRAAASTTGVAKILPAYAGLLLEKEVTILTAAMKQPQQPLAAIIGGAKIADKIEFIQELLPLTDTMVVGGAMANTFLQDESFGANAIGASVFEEGESSTLKTIAKALKRHKTKLILPDKDVAVGLSTADTDRREVSLDMVGHHDLILDMGRRSLETVKAALEQAQTIIWNGPLGYIENPAYSQGSVELARFLSQLNAKVIIGGGDTAEFIREAGLMDAFYHVSTGGGASLELMSGHELPAVAALLDK